MNKSDTDYIKNEINEILKLAKNWNDSIKDKKSAVPQVIIDRLTAIGAKLE